MANEKQDTKTSPASAGAAAAVRPKVPGSDTNVEYIPFGAKDKITLTVQIVRDLVARPTKKGLKPTDADCVKFMLLCRGKQANPFEGDCYMLGYDTEDGPEFSMVCGVDLFRKRAEQSDDYDGRRSGVIVERQGIVMEVEGACPWPGDTLIGGWARVFRKGREHPDYVAVKLATYNTGKSRWAKDPAGMIEKVAVCQATRAAYPTALGGMYEAGEMEHVQVESSVRAPIAMPKSLEETNPGAIPAAEALGGLSQPKEPEKVRVAGALPL